MRDLIKLNSQESHRHSACGYESTCTSSMGIHVCGQASVGFHDVRDFIKVNSERFSLI